MRCMYRAAKTAIDTSDACSLDEKDLGLLRAAHSGSSESNLKSCRISLKAAVFFMILRETEERESAVLFGCTDE